MPTLHEIQSAFAAALVEGNTVAITPAIVADRPGARQRLQIHQNHFAVTLIEVLAATFPVTHRLVGPDFFAFAARTFIRESPPTSPCLFEYGADFPDHIAELPAARPLIYLRDVGRLEWAIHVAYHAPDEPIRTARTDEPPLSGSQRADCIAFHPSCRLISSCFPIDRIWKAHQTDSDDVEPVDLDAGGVRLLVHRCGDEIGWHKFPRAEFAFLRALSLGGDLGDAAQVACALGGNIDVDALLSACLGAGLLTRHSRIS